MINVNNGECAVQGTRADLMEDIIMILNVLLEKNILNEDALIYCVALAKTIKLPGKFKDESTGL